MVSSPLPTDFVRGTVPGPPGLTYMGAWVENFTYVERQVVRHNGSAWVARRPSFNVRPDEASEYWGLLIERGQKGDNAWTPDFGATETSDRIAIGPMDWHHSESEELSDADKPPTGYFGPNGTLVENPAEALNFKGAKGDIGPRGPGGVMLLTNNVGNGTNYTATALPTQTELADGMTFLWTPPEDNGSVQPTLSIDNMTPFQIRSVNGTVPVARQFRAGTSYLIMVREGRFVQVTENNQSALVEEMNADVEFVRESTATVLAARSETLAALETKSDKGHHHPIAEVDGLAAALESKSDEGHGHAIGEITNLQETLDDKAARVHGHVMGEVDGLEAALNLKAPFEHTHPIEEIVGLSDELGDLNTTAIQLRTDFTAEVGSTTARFDEDRARMTAIEEDIQGLSDKDAALDAADATLALDISGLVDRSTDAEGRLAAIEGTLTTAVDTTIPALDGRLDLAEGTIIEHDTAIGALETRADRRDAVVAFGNVTGNRPLDLNAARTFTGTITGVTVFSFTNVPAAGTAIEFKLVLTNPGAFALTWPASVRWAGGAAPAWTTAGRDRVFLYSEDGGVTFDAHAVRDFR